MTEKQINDEKVHKKLLEYSECMDAEFKILGLCKIGHLAIYALEKLNFTEDFQTMYDKLSEEDKIRNKLYVYAKHLTKRNKGRYNAARDIRGFRIVYGY